MIRIYINGCEMCGVNAMWIRKIRAYAEQTKKGFDVINTRYSDIDRATHLNYLRQLGIRQDAYQALVVTDEKEVVKLRQWQP